MAGMNVRASVGENKFNKNLGHVKPAFNQVSKSPRILNSSVADQVNTVRHLQFCELRYVNSTLTLSVNV